MNLQEYRKKSVKLYADMETAASGAGFKIGRIRASVDSSVGVVRLTIELSDARMTDSSGNPTTPNAERFKRDCGIYGLKPEWLGRTFRAVGGKQFTITGMKARGAKCIVTQCGAGEYVWSPDSIIRLMSASVAA